MSGYSDRLSQDFQKVLGVLERSPKIDKQKRVAKEEFQNRARRVYEALRGRGLEVGLVFSDEHYCGDVPYLGGNTNVTDRTGGRCGGTRRGSTWWPGWRAATSPSNWPGASGAVVHKAELLQLADEKYPIRCRGRNLGVDAHRRRRRGQAGGRTSPCSRRGR